MTETLEPTILSASSLWSRYGFGDGKPFTFADRGPAFDDEPPTPLEAALGALDAERMGDLLLTLVERHLLPAILDATGETPTLTRVRTHHNQIRDARFDRNEAEMPAAWEDVDVTITPEQVAEALGVEHAIPADAATTAESITKGSPMTDIDHAATPTIADLLAAKPEDRAAMWPRDAARLYAIANTIGWPSNRAVAHLVPALIDGMPQDVPDRAELQRLMREVLRKVA